MRILNESGFFLVEALAFYVGTDQIEIRTFRQSSEYFIGLKINGLFQQDHRTYDFYQFKILEERDNKQIRVITPLFTLVLSPFSVSLILSDMVNDALVQSG